MIFNASFDIRPSKSLKLSLIEVCSAGNNKIKTNNENELLSSFCFAGVFCLFYSTVKVDGVFEF